MVVGHLIKASKKAKTDVASKLTQGGVSNGKQLSLPLPSNPVSSDSVSSDSFSSDSVSSDSVSSDPVVTSDAPHNNKLSLNKTSNTTKYNSPTKIKGGITNKSVKINENIIFSADGKGLSFNKFKHLLLLVYGNNLTKADIVRKIMNHLSLIFGMGDSDELAELTKLGEYKYNALDTLIGKFSAIDTSQRSSKYKCFIQQYLVSGSDYSVISQFVTSQTEQQSVET
ncbi:hypothetical protein ACTFIR_007771 [Dictyostelium discoideum]